MKKVVKRVQIPKEDGKPEAKDEGGKGVYEEIKLHKTEKILKIRP